MCTVQRTTELRWCNHCHNGKAISITYFQCVFVALDIQQSSCAVFSFVVSPALQYFFTLPRKLRGGDLLNTESVF